LHDEPVEIIFSRGEGVRESEGGHACKAHCNIASTCGNVTLKPPIQLIYAHKSVYDFLKNNKRENENRHFQVKECKALGMINK
jgi:hypothetical protein